MQSERSRRPTRKRVAYSEEAGWPARLAKARHDLRNPLSDVLGFTEMLQEEARADAQTAWVDPLQRIHQLATFILKQINQKLDPDYPQSRRQTYTELERVIQSHGRQIAEAIEVLKEQPQGGAGNLADDLNRIAGAAVRLAEIAPPLLRGMGKSVLPVRSAAARAPEILGAHSVQETQRVIQGSSLSVASLANEPASLAQGRSTSSSSLLVVEDNETNRVLLTRRLSRQGYNVTEAENGRRALALLRQRTFDLVLLDIMMPELDGYGVLDEMKADESMRHIPVIMISALDDLKSLVRCIQRGADDYLTKPFDPVLLGARIGACLEKKRMRDQEQVYLRQLQVYLKQIELEQEKSERLLLNVLPKAIADRLKEGENTIADTFPNVTVLFADLVGFTSLSMHIAPKEMVHLLDEVFSAFDLLAAEHSLEKIKTIGDAYMAVAGLPTPRPDHAEGAADLALAMQQEIEQFNVGYGTSLRMRIGIHSGPVVAGIIGRNKFIYDLWGDTVNTSSRMESHGLPGGIQVSETTFDMLREKYVLRKRGGIEIKGKGNMITYWLDGRRGAEAGTEARA